MLIKILIALGVLNCFSTEARAVTKVRNVAVCVLIEAKNPVKLDTIHKLVDTTSAAYKFNVGITLEVVELHTVKFDPVKVSDVSNKARDECGKGEIIVIFSNQRKSMHSVLMPSRLLGESDEDRGVIRIYEVESRIGASDCNFNPSMTLEHELAHLFGAGDSKVAGSFMSDSQNCGNIWPRALRKTILRHKYMRWNRA